MNHQFKQNKADEYYTKEYAIKPLLKYIPTDKTVWCPFDKQESNFVKLLQERGNNVIFSHIETGQDFFETEPPQGTEYIISNPPYYEKTKDLRDVLTPDDEDEKRNKK